MSMQDPIADMLTRIRNAGTAGLPTAAIPGSREKIAIAAVLKQEGYIKDYSVEENGVKKTLNVELKYCNGKPVIEGIERISKPSRRVHCNVASIPRVRNGLGTVILSTPHGIISGVQAAQENVGGEVICYVW